MMKLEARAARILAHTFGWAGLGLAMSYAHSTLRPGAHATDGTPGYTWKHCERDDLDSTTVPFHPDGSFRPECAPDTLYSWQPRERARSLLPAPGQTARFSFLYSWRTPLQTIRYGDTLVRLKLKPGVKFVFVDESKNVDDRNCRADERDVVHVGFYRDVEYVATEYILCSPDVVESWSFDTPEALAELDREERWIAENTESLDRHEHSSTNPEERARRHYVKAIRPRLDDPKRLPGRVVYAPGVPQDRARHFATRLPSYFNPNPEAALKPAAQAATLATQVNGLLTSPAAPCPER